MKSGTRTHISSQVLLKNSNGFSVVGTLVGVSLLSILTMGLLDVSNHMLRVVQTVEANESIQSELFQLRLALTKSNTCLGNLGGLTLNNNPVAISTSPGLRFPVSDSDPTLGNNFILSSQDPNTSGRVRVTSMSLQKSAVNPRLATLSVVFSTLGQVLAGNTRLRQIPLDITLDSTNRVIRCSTAIADGGGGGNSLSAIVRGSELTMPLVQAGFSSGDGTAARTVTFPRAFKSGTVPIVVLNRNFTPGGDDTDNYACHITNTSFRVCGDSNNWQGSFTDSRVYYQDSSPDGVLGHRWMAIGEAE